MVARSLIQALVLCVVGAALGLGINSLSPHPARLGNPVHPAAESGIGVCHGQPEAISRVEVARATELCSACSAGFVDARPASAYEAGHITGAVHLPPIGHPDEGEVLAKLRQFPTVIVYDGNEDCALAERVAQRLAGHGLTDVRVLSGALAAWYAAGGPGESGACRVCSGPHRAGGH